MDDVDASGPPDRAALVEIASQQAGHFTSDQARQCGYSPALLSHHAKGGNFVRVARGLYRLAEFPGSRHEEVTAAWLAVGKEGAVISHESALDILDLGDVIPDSIHITIPRRERWRRPPPGVTLHTTDSPIPKEQIQVREGIPITSAARSITDSAARGMSEDQVDAAIHSALDRSLMTRTEIMALARKRGNRFELGIGRILDRIPT